MSVMAEPLAYLSVTQVANHLSVSRGTVYQMIHDKKLPYIRVGKGAMFRIPREAVIKKEQ